MRAVEASSTTKRGHKRALPIFIRMVASILLVLTASLAPKLAAAGTSTGSIPPFTKALWAPAWPGQPHSTSLDFSVSPAVTGQRIISASLKLTGTLEALVGQHVNLPLSTCPIVIGSNGFTGAMASAYKFKVGADTHALDSIEIFESWPGLGLPFDDIAHSTQTWDVTNAVKGAVGTGPSSTVSLSFEFSEAPCNLAVLKVPFITLEVALAPEVSVTGPTSPLAAGTSAQLTANYTDPGSDDAHTCLFHWADGSSPSSTGGAGGTCTANHTYSTAGVYPVIVDVVDSKGNSGTGQFQYVVVYDSTGGFVTGGGWVDSIGGACALSAECASVSGKANFGFVSKYKPGATAPSGTTEFQFKAGGLSFKSSSYDWLVVAGPRAQFKGTGTVNGVGSYTFILTATDGQVSGGGGVDKFRIRIWDAGGTVYDNQAGAPDDATPTTALGGGSIVIHK